MAVIPNQFNCNSQTEKFSCELSRLFTLDGLVNNVGV